MCSFLTEANRFVPANITHSHLNRCSFDSCWVILFADFLCFFFFNYTTPPNPATSQVFKCFFSDSDAIKKMYSASVTEHVCWALDRWVASGGDNKVCSCCETSCSERRRKRGLAADAGTVYTSNTTSHLGMNLQHWILTRGETFHTSYVIEKLPKISQKKGFFFFTSVLLLWDHLSRSEGASGT